MELPDQFEDLPAHEQQRVRRSATEMSRLACEHCTSIVIAPPPNTGTGRLNSGSGFVLSLGERTYVGTAWHVVKAWLDRKESGEHLLFQVGHADLPPADRIAWKDEETDVVLLSVDADDVARIGTLPCEAVRGWPPPLPEVGAALVVAGYPGTERLQLDSDSVEFGSFAGLLSVTSVHPTYLLCQFQRDEWIAPEGTEIPPIGADLAGMSGGPAFLVQDLAYPLVGMVAQHNRMFEIMRVTMLAHLPTSLTDKAA